MCLFRSPWRAAALLTPLAAFGALSAIESSSDTATLSCTASKMARMVARARSHCRASALMDERCLRAWMIRGSLGRSAENLVFKQDAATGRGRTL